MSRELRNKVWNNVKQHSIIWGKKKWFGLVDFSVKGRECYRHIIEAKVLIDGSSCG